MTHHVSSFVSGEWTGGSGVLHEVLDPTTGAVAALVHGGGVDLAASVGAARAVGPSLKAMTFHERALMLKSLAKYLTQHTSEVYVDYASSGATMADARVDVEGGIQVLSVYANIGLKEMPSDTIVVDGDAESLIGNPGFVGQTVYTSRPGIAVLINAFNFPVWGMLEKLAPAFLAGLPVIVKPATTTAHLAEIVARQIVESGILPPGSFQFLAGSARELLDHLGVGDYVSVTGSAATAATLRANPAITQRGVLLNAEADSLNATVLGPDAASEQDEFTLFTKAVAREMTSKSGQKCTSIRRVLVPREQVPLVIEALRAQLAKVVIGDPREEGTHMGPLVSADHRADVVTAVRILMTEADVVVGGPDLDVAPDGAADINGYFAPTVLLARESNGAAVHTVEAFGPVVTIIPFDSPSDLVALVGRGEGSLVASVVSNDPQFVREVVRSIAPWHGRVLVVNRDIARGSAPHGAVLPQLIHGGPGRAGGGEELGGRRAVLHLLQATSVASSATMGVSITDRWNAGARQLEPAVHPFRLHLEDLRLGDTLHTGRRLVTIEDIEHFAHFTGDTFYAHMDEAAAAASPIFTGRVAHGYFVLAAAAGLFVDPDPGPVLANVGLDNLRFVQPVYPGDEIKVRLTAKHKALRAGASWGEVTWDVEVTNQRDEVCAAYDIITVNACRGDQPTDA